MCLRRCWQERHKRAQQHVVLDDARDGITCVEDGRGAGSRESAARCVARHGCQAVLKWTLTLRALLRVRTPVSMLGFSGVRRSSSMHEKKLPTGRR